MDSETWLQTQWRPVVAMAYVAIILFDFMIAPVLWTIAQALFSGEVVVAWIPNTLGSGGLFHVAMGGILGISAFTRGQEKLAAAQQHLDDTIRSSNNRYPDDRDE